MKILLRATNWVGDVVMSLPALKALHAAFPRDRLTVLARPWVADLYRLRPEVDEILVEDPAGLHAGAEGRRRLAAELRAGNFDRVLLLPTSFGTAWAAQQAGIPERYGWASEGRGMLLTRALPRRLFRGRHQVWKHLLLVETAGAALPEAPDVSWTVSSQVAEAGRTCLAAAGWDGKPFIAVHLASFAHAAKRWDLPGFSELLDRLADEKRLSAILLGTAGEAAANAEAVALVRRARVLDLSGKSSLPEALGILSLARLFVGNDSGLAHLAGAVGTPTVVVFGPTDPDATRPWDGPRGDGKPVRIAVVRRRTACAPCRFDVCPLDHRCMTGLHVQRVFDAVASLL
jgi:heptosyltransferase-2